MRFLSPTSLLKWILCWTFHKYCTEKNKGRSRGFTLNKFQLGMGILYVVIQGVQVVGNLIFSQYGILQKLNSETITTSVKVGNEPTGLVSSLHYCRRSQPRAKSSRWCSRMSLRSRKKNVTLYQLNVRGKKDIFIPFGMFPCSTDETSVQDVPWQRGSCLCRYFLALQ